MSVIKVQLTRPMVSKLIKGQGIQLKHSDLKGDIELLVSSKAGKKYERAAMAGRGLRLQAGDCDGDGLRAIWEKIKSGAKKAKKFYDKNLKSTVGPIAKKGLDALIRSGEAALVASFPAAAPIVGIFDQKIREPLVEKIGEVSGAYGLGLSKAQARRLLKGHAVQLKHSQIGSGMKVGLSDMNIAKLDKAYRCGKGCRLQISESEGTGLKEIAAYARRAQKLYEKHVPTSVKTAIKKRAKKLVDEGVEQLVRKIEGGAVVTGVTSAVVLPFQPYVPIIPIGAPQPAFIHGSSFRAQGGSFL